MSEATKHTPGWTPGPWEIVRYGDGDSLVICTAPDGNWRICFMATPGGSPGAMEKIKADAHLIAAAPDLAEALEAATDALVCYLAHLPHWSGDPEKEAVVIRARSALSRARGETP